MLGELLRAFITVFPAELPDKTMVATIILVTRYRHPLGVWLGAAAAFLVHVVVAVAAGSAIGLLPERVVGGVVTVLFAVGAVLLLRAARSVDHETEVEVADGDTAGRLAPPASVRAAATGSFGLIVLAEWGDLTQLATASLAARIDFPVATGLGAYLALISVAAIAALAGRQLVARVPLHRINYIGASVFGLLAVWSLFEVVKG